mmetsp:Transcript_30806/g.73369  ORF Transcript_30806/g.73369 Transcript_30806/m.73369 type:complete len:237 (-) Transcript_30806:238-948(-)
MKTRENLCSFRHLPEKPNRSTVFKIKLREIRHLVAENHRLYASLHGYTYFDESSLLDSSRPANWSKIKAVLKHLKDFEYIMWLDADAFVTNNTIRVESFLPSVENKDIILTKDASGYNSGVWLVRSCSWSEHFLEAWWNMTNFIRTTPGDTKSGDNDALKHCLSHMSTTEYEEHVGVVPQCVCNSYWWKNSPRNFFRNLRQPSVIEFGLWRRGDFILHLAGVENKQSIAQQFFSVQ